MTVRNLISALPLSLQFRMAFSRNFIQNHFPQNGSYSVMGIFSNNRQLSAKSKDEKNILGRNLD
jgi:hypothetical protein